MSPSIDSLVRVSRVNGRELKSDRIQRESNEYAIEGHGYRLARHVEALNVSGGLVAAGEQWQQVIERVRCGESAGAAVNHIHRLSRDVATGLAWVDELGAAGGVLISGGRIINLANPHERHMLISELNNSELALNIYKVSARETMADVKKRGVLNRVPFGYQRCGEMPEPKKLVPHPRNAPIVELIFTMRANGERWPSIIGKLHALGVSSPSGQPYWTEGTLGGMVRNRVYRGEVHMGRRTADHHVTRKAHEAIVSEELYKAAQSSQTRVLSGKHVGGVAHGLLTCSGCGLPLSVHTGGRGRLFYGCRRTSGNGPCPAPVNGVLDKLDAFVDDEVAAKLDGGGIDVVDRQRDLTAAKAAMAEAEGELEQWTQAARGMSADAIRAKLEELTAEVERAREVYEQARAAAKTRLPESSSAYRRLPVQDRRIVARWLIAELALKPFPRGASKCGANPADRLRLRWA